MQLNKNKEKDTLESVAIMIEELLLKNIEEEPSNQITIDKGFIVSAIEMIRTLRRERDEALAMLSKTKEQKHNSSIGVW